MKRWVRDEDDAVVFSYIMDVLAPPVLCVSGLNLDKYPCTQSSHQPVCYLHLYFTRHVKVQSARSHTHDETMSGLEPTHCAPGLPLVSIMLLPSLHGANVSKIT